MEFSCSPCGQFKNTWATEPLVSDEQRTVGVQRHISKCDFGIGYADALKVLDAWVFDIKSEEGGDIGDESVAK